LAPMAPAENLMASIVFILLVIVFWEVGRSIIKKIFYQIAQVFRKSPFARPYPQNHEYQVCQAKANFLQDIKQETSTIVGQGHVASMLIKDRILKEAREEAQKILGEAKSEIERIRMEALQNVQRDMIEMVFSLNQYWQKNSTGHVPCFSKVSQSAIEKYLDSYHALKGNTHHTSRLL
jgi:vacuolar-type H+-ATPase subunit H